MATRPRCRSDSLQGRNIKKPFIPSVPGPTKCAQQRIPTIEVTADPKGKGKAIDYTSRTPIADEFMSEAFKSQRCSTSSMSSIESASTEQADLSHISSDMYAPGPSSSKPVHPRSTPIPFFPSPPVTSARVSVPETGVTISQSESAPVPTRGHRSEFEGNGGCTSETSSVCTERPTQHKMYLSAATSSTRRDNPKANGPNGGREVCLQVPAPKVKPVFDVVAEYHGLELFRISDAVPYLLSTRNIRTRLASITEDNLSHTPNIHPGKISRGSPDAYSSLDLSLMAILHSLRNASSTRQAVGNWYTQGLATRKDSLILYEHTAATGPEQTLVSAAKFHDMAQTWLLLRNPSNKSGDLPHAINSWIDIITGLRKQNVDISKIDTKLYYELTTVLEGEALRRRIAEIARWSRTGHLDKRYAVWCKYVEGTEEKKIKVTGTQHTVTTAGRKEKDTRTDGLYTKRFAHEHHRHHQHPLGRPRSLVSDDDEKAQRRAGKAIRAFTAATAAALETQRKERIDQQGGVMRGMARGWANRKKRNTVLFVLFITFFLGPLVGVLLWAMAMRKFDWTPGAGEGY
ncbi:hypothetical protein CC77DRAFT_1054005 [Alternaria alternata]|uniref:Uncharacterized protein n=1 Tax=Alternaria alternata TaxID=5599 RepID=A0A177D8L5_ALTAL|nr:hypothetical protein CC77DRAFT_1054005 [Alternaria alternata]OAG15452.1 hypothetical protein CC77DRAFT_1054005 [Alternaria alternata]